MAIQRKIKFCCSEFPLGAAVLCPVAREGAGKLTEVIANALQCPEHEK